MTSGTPEIPQKTDVRQARPIPIAIQKKYKAWRDWATRWTWSNVVMGITSSLCSTLVASNAHAHFLTSDTVVGVSMLAGALTFLVSTLQAEVKAKGFVLAAREIETAVADFEFSETAKESDLAKAVVRGIAILNTFDAKKEGA